jgi:hypothetical protein
LPKPLNGIGRIAKEFAFHCGAREANVINRVLHVYEIPTCEMMAYKKMNINGFSAIFENFAQKKDSIR